MGLISLTLMCIQRFARFSSYSMFSQLLGGLLFSCGPPDRNAHYLRPVMPAAVYYHGPWPSVCFPRSCLYLGLVAPPLSPQPSGDRDQAGLGCRERHSPSSRVRSPRCPAPGPHPRCTGKWGLFLRCDLIGICFLGLLHLQTQTFWCLVL